jgi:hypothetical protein
MSPVRVFCCVVRCGLIGRADATVDVSFYKTFWGLQDFFKKPALALERW